MDRDHILTEIRRTAVANRGVPLGWRRFLTETGIRVADWHGKYWVRWGDALKEAGFAANALTSAYDDDDLVAALASLIKELGHFPVIGDLRMKRRADSGFPNDKTLRRLGTKNQVAALVANYCRSREGFESVVAICEPLAKAGTISVRTEPQHGSPEDGYVYLMKSGKRYRIGATNDIARRGREVAVQMPDPTNTIHVIRTDDPFGIEAYWHRRFADKRKGGEWFDLDRADISAFRRRKYM